MTARPASEVNPVEALWPQLPEAAPPSHSEIPAQTILNYLAPMGGTNSPAGSVLVPVFVPPPPPPLPTRSSQATYEVK